MTKGQIMTPFSQSRFFIDKTKVVSNLFLPFDCGPITNYPTKEKQCLGLLHQLSKVVHKFTPTLFANHPHIKRLICWTM